MPWPFGRKRTEDEKKRIADSLRGRKRSADHSANISAARTGKKYPRKPKDEKGS